MHSGYSFPFQKLSVPAPHIVTSRPCTTTHFLLVRNDYISCGSLAEKHFCFLMSIPLFSLPVHLRSLLVLQSATPVVPRIPKLLNRRPTRSIAVLRNTRSFSAHVRKMADLSVELTAPNGKKYTQPLGLFINSEFVKSSDGKKITSINPT
jgi:hypothetical protein